jgi:hypothetical protein|tara:strand:+ start:84 stop:632 length:549 start_codon:yes stop_codon:yes gene_type:complete
MKEKEELIAEIAESIKEVADTKEVMKRGSLSRHNPEKVAKLLYLYSNGTSQTRLVRKYGYERNTVVSVLADYADYIGKFRELSGKIAAKNYLSMSSLEEDLIQQVRDRMETGELEPTFRDLKELSIAKANSAREALTARGEATQITEDRKVYTQDDYEETILAAKARIEAIKNAEVIDIDGD